jgi:hypothetical protein
MSMIVQQLFRRSRPRVGWPLLILAFTAALTPAVAAANGPLNLPAATFGWAGLLGLLVGLRGPRTENREPPRGYPTENREPRTRIKPALSDAEGSKGFSVLGSLCFVLCSLFSAKGLGRNRSAVRSGRSR